MMSLANKTKGKYKWNTYCMPAQRRWCTNLHYVLYPLTLITANVAKELHSWAHYRDFVANFGQNWATLTWKKYKIKENSITLSLSIHVQETLKERV